MSAGHRPALYPRLRRRPKKGEPAHNSGDEPDQTNSEDPNLNQDNELNWGNEDDGNDGGSDQLEQNGRDTSDVETTSTSPDPMLPGTYPMAFVSMLNLMEDETRNPVNVPFDRVPRICRDLDGSPSAQNRPGASDSTSRGSGTFGSIGIAERSMPGIQNHTLYRVAKADRLELTKGVLSFEQESFLFDR